MTQQQALEQMIHAGVALGWSPSRTAEETGPYSILGELAQRLVACMQADETKHFGNVFESVETILGRASPETRDLIIVGFLEDLQNISLDGPLGLSAWTSWLGTSTREAWDTVEAAWSGRLSPAQFNDAIRGGRSGPKDLPTTKPS